MELFVSIGLLVAIGFYPPEAAAQGKHLGGEVFFSLSLQLALSSGGLAGAKGKALSGTFGPALRLRRGAFGPANNPSGD